MVDVSAVKSAIEGKTGLSRRQVNRLVSKKADDAVLPVEIAVLALAKEKGVSLQKLASSEELAHLRAATNQHSVSVPDAAPPMTAPEPSRVPRKAPTPRPKPGRPTRGRTIFVVHGRNEPLRRDLFVFLRSLDLEPLEWNAGIKATKIASPTVKQIVDALFEKAVAVVVLLTPDDLVTLKPELRKPKGELRIETEQVGQARPNVLFEAGVAINSHPASTVLVQIGDVKPFTDVGGVHITHLNNSPASRTEFVTKLQNAGCLAKTDGTEWYTAGDFEQETY